MKTTGTQPAVRSRRRSQSRRLWSRLGRQEKKYRLPANVTGEDDWEVDVPQIRMSRAFGVMLVLHLVAVGGLFAFHMFGRDDHAAREQAGLTPPDAGTPPAAPVSTPAPAAPVPASGLAAAPAPSSASAGTGEVASAASPKAAPSGGESSKKTEESEEAAPPPRGYIQHTIRKGESKELLASTYQISVKELMEANPKSKFTPGTAVNIPPPGGKIITSVDPVETPVAEPELLEPTGPATGIVRAGFAASKSGEEKALQATQVVLRSRESSTPARAEREVKEGKRTSASSAGAKEKTAASKAETSARQTTASRAKPSAVSEETAAKKKETAKASAPVKSAGGTRSHVVQKGDTVYNLARRYNISVNDVLKHNNISDPSKLQLGQVLKIPVRR